MGIWGAFLTGFKTLALDATAALLNGPAPTVQKDLKDKAARSNAYGTPWSRFRGRVRANGKVLWATNIQTSIWKTVSGGLFGIGQKSVYYNKYSFSVFVGFGKKLGGGAASSILRIWADGKPLFNSVASTGNITGTVTVTVVGGGQIAGSLVLLVNLASGASIALNPGDQISVPGDPLPYTVQQAVSSTGPATSVQIQIWPPLRVDLAGGGAVTFAQNGINGAAPWDLSSFDPNPHDGSHPSGGYLCPPGGAAFYLGGSTQGQDPTMVKWLGAPNVSAYRGMVAVCLHDLQLANYGDHQPQITAEIAYDTAAPLYPLNGPISASSAPLSPGALSMDSLALPFSGNEAVQWVNPFTQRLPYLWVLSSIGQDATHDGTIYRFNTQTNQVEASARIPRVGTFRLTGAGMVADDDGFLYFVQNNTQITKFDGMAMQIVATASWFSWNVLTLYPYDTQQSLFGNALRLKLLYAGGLILDRNTLLTLGTANSMSPSNVVTGYDTNGNPIITAGNAILITGGDFGTPNVTDDGQGNIWAGNGDLQVLNGQFQSSVYLDQNNVPHPYLALPSFASTAISDTLVSPAVPVSCGSVQYYAGDNSVVAFSTANGGTATKVSCSSLAVIASATGLGISGNATKISSTYDPMGSILVTASDFARIDLGSLSVLATYNVNSWPVTPVFGSGWMYDPYSDSAWFNGTNGVGGNGALNQALLNRGNGSGLGIDQLVSSLLLECGYASGQFDVSSLAASGLTFGGWECERKTYKESLQEMMRYFLFDVAEVDGKLVCVMRGQASAVTIPETDLGALEEPSKYEPRLIETIQDERDVPVVVTGKYYDYLKDDQMAAQEARRITTPYASLIVGPGSPPGPAIANLTTKQQLDIVSPLFENAALVKQQVDKIIWDLVAGRYTRKAKLGPKYLRLDPTDVVTYTYKTLSLITRLMEADLGAKFARDLTGVSQDASVYSSAITASATSGGTGSGVPPTPPAKSHGTYTISPLQPLSSPNPTTIDLAAFTAAFQDGLRTSYAARTFTVPDPGAGQTAIYYVTVADPNFTGDQPPGTPSLAAFDNISAAAAFVGQYGYIYAGAVLVVGTLSPIVPGGPIGQGGQPSSPAGISQIVVEVPTGSINSSNKIFDLSQTPLEMYALIWNGQVRFDFSLNGQTVTASFTPDTGDTLYAVYFI